MIYRTPPLDTELTNLLDELDRLRAALHHELSTPSPWLGTLRRQARVASVESSVSIEGFTVPDNEAAAIVDKGETADSADDNRLAVACYARALDHVGTMAIDPQFGWCERVILDLHFEACYFQRDKSPGLWRTGPVGVTGADGGLIYQAPEGDDVVPLMGEVVAWLRGGDMASHVAVRGAMAHLHTVSVHPFRDGNGRISRLVQSLVLALDGLLSPEFASIEEYLATHTTDYYAVLQRVQGGRYQPERDATEWVGFCVEAHLAQAQARLEQIEAAGARWAILVGIVEARAWPDRLVIALEQSLIGGTDRDRYSTEADVSFATASNDLRRLLDAGLVTQVGRGRTTGYQASEDLQRQIGAA
jgi:Fic family protein